jgi:uroporphyrinogen-III synthase
MVRVIVTRPEREAQAWLRPLAARGWDVLALPLIHIGEAPDQQSLRAAWRAIQDADVPYRALMFVSASAVEGFWAARSPVQPGLGRNAGSVRCWATGPGTRRALLAAGVSPGDIDTPSSDAGQFDSEALWLVVGAHVSAGDRVLVVRGADGSGPGAGRDWLAQQLRAAGAGVDFVVSYVRSVPVLDKAQLALARQAATDGSVWLFSSSQALSQLQQLLPGQDWSRARAVASHSRIEKAVREAGFGTVKLVRPVMEELIASIESFP